jgi:hypothetical protein
MNVSAVLLLLPLSVLLLIRLLPNCFLLVYLNMLDPFNTREIGIRRFPPDLLPLKFT